jgi:hypothetical protein
MRRGPKDYRSDCHQNAICDVCGGKFKASELRRRWDNLMVCPDDMEQRHPQDLIKVKADRQATPFSRPQPELQFRAMAPTDGSEL